MTTYIKHISVLITLLLSLHSFADTLTVVQDGTGDYTIIQDAVAASSDGGTVLVWPGTYYENIDFIGKNITLASLVLTTGDESYKYITIIDGDSTGSCVRVTSGENVTLNGFTLQHGSGTEFANPDMNYGGGIYTTGASCTVQNCIVKNNFANAGGGGISCFFDGNVELSKTSIHNNYTYGSGGGISIGWEGSVIFDSIFRCSLYSNFSSKGCDLHRSAHELPLKVFLDTCTVQEPDWYFFSSQDQDQYQIDNLIINILNHVITPVDADLYVNPQTGNNSNNGLSPGEPLKTISYAYSLIYPDSINKNAIYLANGIYSDSVNGEKFPFNIRGYVDIKGQSRDYTILDGMYKSPLLKGNRQVSNYSFRNMTLYRGGRVYPNTVFHVPAGIAMLYGENDNIVFDSILLLNGHQYSTSGNFSPQASNNVLISNCEFRDNLGGMAVSMGANTGDTTTFSNCRFLNNMPDYEQDTPGGGALVIFGYNTATIVKGCLFSGNNNDNIATVGGYATNTSDYFVNCTFTGNTFLEDNISLGFNDASTYMYNCIVFNEGNDVPISVFWSEVIDTISLNIYSSLIENGEESIYLRPGLTSLHYDETNIEGDPLFYYGSEFPYNLSDNSPCINIGTLNLPAFIELPEFDIAGNPRIFNDSIDMGAYEWNPTVGVDEYQPIKVDKDKLLKAVPNPFSSSTTITAIFKTKANIKLEIYNNYGQRVKVLFNGTTLPGTSQIKWSGDDDGSGKKLTAGVYYVILSVDGKESESLKVIYSD